MIKVNGKEIEVRTYPDGAFKFPEIHVTFKHPRIEWYYESMNEFVQIIYLARHFWNYRLMPKLYMPYIPDARMDRVKRSSEVFTLKYLAETLNTLHFSSVEVLDPHSDVSAALINNVIINSPVKYLACAINNIINNDNLVLFYPDAGSAKRYSGMVRMPYSYGIKNRDWETGDILSLDIVSNSIDLKGKNILIVDDICSKGGTFYYSAKKLKELGVNDIYLYITHCENSILEGSFTEKGINLLETGLIKKVFTTNSIFTKEHSNIEVFDIRGGKS